MDSSPKAGQMLDTAPEEVSVTFNEGVGPIFFKILDRDGNEVGAPGEIRLDGTRMILPLGANLPNGTYILTYRVISADTHPVGTTFGFSIGEPMTDTSALEASSAQASTPWTWAVALNRWVLYAAMLLAAGSALATLLLSLPAATRARTFRVGRAAAIVAAVAYLLAIGFGGAEMVLGSFAAFFDGATWARGLASTLAASAAIGVPAMLLLAWAFSAEVGKSRTGALAVGAAAAIASFLVTGHAATAPPVWLLATVVAVHLAAVAFWFGSLYPLWHSTKTAAVAEAGALMTQFSTRAVWAVGAVVVSGVVISWNQLENIGNLFGNEYGNSLIRKLVLFLIVLGIAGYNKLKLTPALERGDAGAAPRMRRTITIEYVVYLLIVGAAMTLTLSTPPRANMAQAATGTPGMTMGTEGFTTTIKSDSGYSVDIELTPARAGENMLMATVKDPSGQVLTDMADLEIVTALESAGISDIRLKGEKLPNGMWHVMIGEMLIPGKWDLEVDAFVSDFDKVEFETSVDIQ